MEKIFRSTTFLENGEADIKIICKVDIEIETEGCYCEILKMLDKHLSPEQFSLLLKSLGIDHFDLYHLIASNLKKTGYCSVENPTSDGKMRPIVYTLK